MAAVAGQRVWFKLEGAASADCVDLAALRAGALVVDLRDAIHAKNKARLEPQRVVPADLVLSSADGKTNYDDEEAPCRPSCPRPRPRR